MIELVAVGGDDEERAALHSALAESIAQDEAGDTIDADEVLARLSPRAS